MPEVFGSGDFTYTFVDGWAKLPTGMTFKECPGVAVDSRDNVYVLTRGEEPIIVLDKDGNYIRSFGKGLFSDDRTHGLYIAQDDSVLVADDGSQDNTAQLVGRVTAEHPNVRVLGLPHRGKGWAVTSGGSWRFPGAPSATRSPPFWPATCRRRR